jgi:hypothetical protein
MDVTILGSVGRNGKNYPGDVAKIQQLLFEVGLAPYSLPGEWFDFPQSRIAAAGSQTCAAKPAVDPATVSAIEEFQQLWGGSVDGCVEPGRNTLERLNETKKPLRLAEIKLAYLNNTGIYPCGYWIRYTGKTPPNGYQVLLSVSAAPLVFEAGSWLKAENLADFMNITARDRNCVICQDNLPQLLALMNKNNLWATTAIVTLLVTKGYKVISRSISAFIECPVKPYAGNLRASLGNGSLGEEAGTPPLLYNGAANGSGGGAMFHIPAVEGKYYFEYGGRFETDNSRRGFDCTTFAGAVFNVNPNTGAMAGTAETLANHLGAQSCAMEEKTGAQVKTFFSTHKTGTYILGSGGHVMIVVDGVIHEFTLPVGQPGYRHGDVQNSNLQSTYFVRKL